jgi:uncharacterized protein (TIGR03086 family)
MATSDHRPPLMRAFTVAAGVTRGVRTAQLSLPTPCPAWDVAASIDHLVAAGHRTVALGRGEATRIEASPHADLADAPGELQAAGSDAAAAWADDGRLTATVTMPWGEVYTGAILVDTYLAELATHSWDLAMATGQTLGDDALAEAALDAARAMLRPDYRNMIEDGSPFGPEIDPPPHATAWERLAAFMGRGPISARAPVPREET